MNIKNAAYRDIVPNWSAITLPLRAGTPIGLSGLVCNDENAVGIIPQNIDRRPLIETVQILIGGDVELAEVEAAYGESLAEAALTAMSGIRFFGSDGTPVPDYLKKGELVPSDLIPAATESARGGVKRAAYVNGVPTGESADAAANATAINELIDSLMSAGIMTTGITITQQPPDTQIALGASVDVPLTAVGHGLTYQWYVKNADAPRYSKSSITTAHYTMTEFPATADGRTIYCVITDAFGNSVTSDVATLTLAPAE